MVWAFLGWCRVKNVAYCYRIFVGNATKWAYWILTIWKLCLQLLFVMRLCDCLNGIKILENMNTFLAFWHFHLLVDWLLLTVTRRAECICIRDKSMRAETIHFVRFDRLRGTYGIINLRIQQTSLQINLLLVWSHQKLSKFALHECVRVSKLLNIDASWWFLFIVLIISEDFLSVFRWFHFFWCVVYYCSHLPPERFLAVALASGKNM